MHKNALYICGHNYAFCFLEDTILYVQYSFFKSYF